MLNHYQVILPKISMTRQGLWPSIASILRLIPPSVSRTITFRTVYPLPFRFTLILLIFRGMISVLRNES